MKVLMTADTLGGVWTYAIDLCRALEPLGIEVTLATMGAPPGAAQREEVAACRGVTLHESTFRLEWMHDPWPDVAAAGDWLLALERRTRPDVVHLNGYAHGALPWSAPVLVAGHSCVLSWWRAVHGCDAPPEWSRYRAAVTQGLHAAGLVVAPTRAMLEALRHSYGPLPCSRVIPNGRPATNLPSGPRPEPLVLAAGRVWDEAKNMATLAAAAPLMRWPVYVAGPDRGPDRGSAGRRAPLAGVHQLGALTPAAMRQWYRRAAVFVHPSLYEPFGLAPLEAAVEGAALVLSDIPSLREVWGDAAHYVPARDAPALADAVNALAAHPALLAERAAAARRRARTLTATAMARGYDRAYRDLAAGAVPALEAAKCAS
jgi:glycogen synthase